MFIYSLPILFANMEVGTPVELLIIALVILAVLFMSAPHLLAEEELQKPDKASL